MGRRSRSVGRTRGSSRSRSLWLIIALVAVAGTAASVFVPTLVRAQALSAAGSRAENFISDAMAVTLRRTDAAHPVSGARYAELDRTLHQNLPAGAPVVQLTVWRTDGTILFSTEAGLVGKAFPDRASGLSMVVRHGPKTESHPAPPTDNGPRPYPGPTLVTRDALKVGGTNPVTGVAEVVQDYGTIVSPAEGLSLPVTGAFIVATLLAVGVLLAMALSRYEGSARTPAVTASPSTPTWYRGRTRRGAPGGPAPTALSPATGVNTLLQRLQARIQESAAQRIAAEDKARVAEDKARVAEERVNVIEGQAREKEEQLSATQSEVERLQVLLREAHEGGAGQAPDAPTAQELAEELNAARERATAAEEELAEAKRHVASARDEDTLIRARAAQVEERLAATASRIEHLEARLAQSAEEVRAAHARAEQAEGWARQLQTDLQDAARRAENAEGRLRHVEETAEPTAQRAEAVEEWSRHLEEELEEARRRSSDS